MWCPPTRGTVHFVSSDYLATLPADMTYGDSDAGSRTYPHGVTLRQEGNQTITVSDGNIISATVTVAVADAGISTLVLSTVSPTIAGAPMDVTVTAEDAYGNVAQGYRGTVVITGQDPCGTYGAPMVFGAADDGNKFSPQQVTLLTAGSQLLTASDANNAAIAASNALVTVLPGPATLFALNAPANPRKQARRLWLPSPSTMPITISPGTTAASPRCKATIREALPRTPCPCWCTSPRAYQTGKTYPV